MSPGTHIFTATPYTTDQIVLGSLVPDERYPNQDALVLTELREDIDFKRRLDNNFSDNWHTETAASFRAKITKLFSASLEGKTEGHVEIAAKDGSQNLKSFEYALCQPRDHFRRLCDNVGVKRWLEERYMDSDEPCLVIGYRSLLDASVRIVNSESGKAAAAGRLPVGAAAGDPSPDSALDPELKAEYSRAAGHDTAFVAPGERVFAVAYRKVRFAFFTGMDGQRRMSLGKDNCWKPVTRGRKATTPEEEEVIEVSIKDAGNVGQHDDSELCVEFGDEMFIELGSN